MTTGPLKWQSHGEGEGGGSEGRGEAARVGRGQSAKFVERKTLMLCVVWKMTCFLGPDGSFFRVLLAFSDWADFARILLSMLEPGARAPAFSPMQVDTAVQVKGWRVSGGSSLCLRGHGRVTPAANPPPLHKMGEPWLPVRILSVIWKTNTSTELSTNRCCRWLDPGSYKLCWKQGRLVYSRSARYDVS